MTRLLFMLLRVCALLACGTLPIALFVARSEPSSRENDSVCEGCWEVLNEERSPSRKSESLFSLVDRRSERWRRVSLPVEDRWGPVSISPWCDTEGKGELVAHCYSSAQSRDGGYFWGLVRMRLPEAVITDRIELDVLPTGRPCWLPERPGQVLFAAGDGKLYRCGFGPPDGSAAKALSDSVSARSEGRPDSSPTPVEWRCPIPLGNSVVISDPIWPVHPRLSRYVFCTLGSQRHGSRLLHADPAGIWWLRMSSDGMTIEEANPLGPSPAHGLGDRGQKHFPNVAVSPSGLAHLAYLMRIAGRDGMCLVVQSLDFDAESGPGTVSGRPRLAAGSQPRVLGSGCAPVMPVFSADASVLFAIEHGTGRVMRLPLEPVPSAKELTRFARTD